MRSPHDQRGLLSQDRMSERKEAQASETRRRRSFPSGKKPVTTYGIADRQPAEDRKDATRAEPVHLRTTDSDGADGSAFARNRPLQSQRTT